MFEQLQPEGWLSKVSLRGAILNAIGFGFVAGMTLGVLILKAILLRVPYLSLGEDLLYLVVASAASMRFYFLAMSRARSQGYLR